MAHGMGWSTYIVDIFLPYKTLRARITAKVFDCGQESSVCYTVSEFVVISLF